MVTLNEIIEVQLQCVRRVEYKDAQQQGRHECSASVSANKFNKINCGWWVHRGVEMRFGQTVVFDCDWRTTAGQHG